MVNSEGESESKNERDRWNGARTSFCTRFWTGARFGEGEQSPFRRRKPNPNRRSCPIRLATSAVEPFSGEGWAPVAEVSGLASLLFEIALYSPPIGARASVPRRRPPFIMWMIEDGRRSRRSFADIVTRGKANEFQIMVTEFIARVEPHEPAGDWDDTHRIERATLAGNARESRKSKDGIPFPIKPAHLLPLFRLAKLRMHMIARAKS
jgi:hypothetical protein